MKIIEKGTPPPPNWPKRHICKKCKSVLEYDKSDVMDNTDPRDNIPDYWIECPVCQSQETVR